ncbi:MAG: MoaD/ThiS family protein [Thermoanaerobacteraceae bacterium]|nr:MoaD/ThiS family protein [Thermoanaerobacteraceae bacterium]
MKVSFFGFWQMMARTGSLDLELPCPSTVSSLLKLLSSRLPALGDPAVAHMLGLSLNGKRVPAEEWDRTPVEDGDQLEIFNAVVGG